MSFNELKDKVINWHQPIYPYIDNTPNAKSLNALNGLCLEILVPIQKKFGEVNITYGFTAHKLLSQIRKLNPTHIAPNIDQHSSYEVNTKGNVICDRGGAACDIFVAGFENSMYDVANWIADNLPFDRIYLYGNDRPVHVSYGPEHSRFIQAMTTNEAGKRFPGKRGTNKKFAAIIGEVDEP